MEAEFFLNDIYPFQNSFCCSGYGISDEDAVDKPFASQTVEKTESFVTIFFKWIAQIFSNWFSSSESSEGLSHKDQKRISDRLGIPESSGKEVALVLDKAYPQMKVHKSLGKGAFSEAYLFEFKEGEKRVLKLTDVSSAMQGDSAVSSFRLTKDRMGGEWLALLDYSDTVVNTEKALAYDHNKKCYVLIDAATVRDLFEHPQKREGLVYTLVGTVSEYVEGSRELTARITDEKPLNTEEIQSIAKQVFQGVVSIHERGGRETPLAHRDLKPENVLIDEEGHIKIIDFGFARAANWGQLRRRPSFVGSDNFMAPEIARTEFYNEKVDSYSLGALLFKMITGSNLTHRFEIEGLSSVDRDLKDLMLQLTELNSIDRPSPKEALRHRFFSL